MPLFCRNKANFTRKILAKDSPQSELRISRYKGNGEGAERENAETERDRETDPISEGFSPLPHHGGQGPEGNPFSHLGRRSRKKKKKGGPSPPCFRWRRSAAGGHHHHRDLHQHLRHLHQHLSPTTRCTLYLNMVLYASYYYPMMCCHPMMSE